MKKGKLEASTEKEVLQILYIRRIIFAIISLDLEGNPGHHSVSPVKRDSSKR